VVVTGLVAVWLAGCVNVFNFMDGINGISAAHAIVAGAALGVVGVVESLPLLRGGGFVMMGAAVAFLPWNAAHAKIFLGDVGSYAIGGFLGVLVAHALLRGVPVEAALGPMVLYLADTGWTLLRRLRGGEPLCRPHRTHVYQRLTDAGLSHGKTALLAAFLTSIVTLCGMASMLPNAGVSGRVVADVIAGLLVVAYLNLPERLRGRADTLHMSRHH
jgi:UDP-GlcNAc:undecaprenyl-phosphate/decaprenyl-phosphate GlcNAc-1-phosphate transferase